jgi:peroxiredoxin
MTIAVGDRIPGAQLAVMADGVQKMTTGEIFGWGKVVLFSVPGAFTPTCSVKHLPGFMAHADQIMARGVDRIACMSVNDVFVMSAWGENQSVGDRIMMLADGNGEFAAALGLQMDASSFGMGQRSKRFAMVTQDGVVTHLMVESPGEFKVSTAESVLSVL